MPFGGLFSVALVPSLSAGRRYRPPYPVEPGLSSCSPKQASGRLAFPGLIVVDGRRND